LRGAESRSRACASEARRVGQGHAPQRRGEWGKGMRPKGAESRSRDCAATARREGLCWGLEI
ncbi:MAG: hypothetical protein RSD32_08295, partial [Oscillospiraceae bacterium]